jgi:hypothetical protein
MVFDGGDIKYTVVRAKSLTSIFFLHYQNQRRKWAGARMNEPKIANLIFI